MLGAQFVGLCYSGHRKLVHTTHTGLHSKGGRPNLPLSPALGTPVLSQLARGRSDAHHSPLRPAGHRVPHAKLRDTCGFLSPTTQVRSGHCHKVP